MYVAGIESAVFWGSIMAVILAFPILGPPLVWIFIWIPAVVYLVATGQHFQALGLLLFLSIAVHPIDNILRPILVGRDTQMPELLIFFGTLGGLGLFGVFGIIIGPIIAALFMTVWEMYAETFSDYLKEINGTKPPEDIFTK
jgi:predicted PurR-regulated permease PerM